MNEFEEFIRRYTINRQKTEIICKPLLLEDYVIQSCDDVSPPKWHLAHTTWFFETFILAKNCKNYKLFDPFFSYLFNSYYQSLGNPFPRAERGLLSRPSINSVYQYRAYVDQCMIDFLSHALTEQYIQMAPILELGIQHEQQHQELLFMDIKHNLSKNIDFPAYRAIPQSTSRYTSSARLSPFFTEMPKVLFELGFKGKGFGFDNEFPKHQKVIYPFAMSNYLVTNKEYLEFIEEDGYKRPEFWLADGWDHICKLGWYAPLYWRKENKEWKLFTLSGSLSLSLEEPVCHVSYYEAAAYARFRKKRLPTEEEWEYFVVFNELQAKDGNFLESGYFHPQTKEFNGRSTHYQFFGDVWEWTLSDYSPYPGFKPLMGDLEEYNGKFMNNQKVLKGGCCATPIEHIRASYRNFYPPSKRWQFSGIRLAYTIDG